MAISSSILPTGCTFCTRRVMRTLQLAKAAVAAALLIGLVNLAGFGRGGALSPPAIDQVTLINVPEGTLKCDWQQGDPVAYVVKPNRGHDYDSGHWFHIAEAFVGRHGDLMPGFGSIYGDVYVLAPSPAWFKGLTLTTCLLVALGLTAGGAERVIFIPPPFQLQTQSDLGRLILPPTATQLILDNSQQPKPFRLVQSKAGSDGEEVCVKMQDGAVGSFGKHREFWFSKAGSLESLRSAIDNYCPRGEGEVKVEAGDLCRVLIYDRDKSRRFRKLHQLKSDLAQLHPGWAVDVLVHSDERHPCDLAQELRTTSMLVTPHGFQNVALMLLLPPGARVLEVYPYKYYKPGYGPLAAPLDLDYRYAMSPPTSVLQRLLAPFPEKVCMRWYWCRSLARSGNVVAPADWGTALEYLPPS
ncbi:unnamed protein product [Chrysoparadoxa australica]